MTSGPSTSGPANPLTRCGRWLFTDRTTGKIVVAQFPNWSLGLFIVATLVGFVVPAGRPALVVHVVAAVGLAIWAVDEIVRGCNPFRRMLGAAVLAFMAFRWLHP